MVLHRCQRGCIAKRAEVDEYYIPNPSGLTLTAYDWGASFTRTPEDNAFVQVQFKNSRKAFFMNTGQLSLRPGDVVALAASPGHDVGVVLLTGWLARREYLRSAHRQRGGGQLPCVYRKATENDISKWLESIELEDIALKRAKICAEELDLKMKISDVEFQGDGTKAVFYYSAERRVDFRDMVRRLATEFRVRIEMRQIGPRQEAGRLGGIGICGKQLCCGSWLREFASVNTATIKMQDLTPNPVKQAGQCGKLRCCLNYEAKTYAEVKEQLPKIKAPLELENARLFYVKNDLFRGLMWFSTEPKSNVNLTALDQSQVREIMRLNAEGKKGAALNKVKVQPPKPVVEELAGYKNVTIEDSITRFDRVKRKSKPSKRRQKPGRSPKPQPKRDAKKSQ